MNSAELHQKITDKIASIAEVAEDFPGVVIIHKIEDMTVLYVSQKGLDYLGVNLEDLQKLSAEEYHDRYFNPEDAKEYVPKIVSLLERNTDESISIFQQVRISEDHDWVWHMSSIRILMRDDDGNPLLTITMSYPVDPMSHVTAKVSRLLEENEFLRKHQKTFASLTPREVEILRLMALGKNSGEMSEELNISEKTATTHRRNVRAKLKAQSSYDITRFAQAFDLI